MFGILDTTPCRRFETLEIFVNENKEKNKQKPNTTKEMKSEIKLK